jgi:hypothetical protein
MALTNNTGYRQKKLIINKKENGSLVTTGGFPIVMYITNGFPGHASLTDAEFRVMTDAAYNARLTAFYAHIQSIYPFFKIADALNPASGIDAASCPINNSTPANNPATTVTAGLDIPAGGTVADHLRWSIKLQRPVTIATGYTFQITIRDKSNNMLRTETVTGIIPAGSDTHLSTPAEKYYISEASNPALTPLILTASLATVAF